MPTTRCSSAWFRFGHLIALNSLPFREQHRDPFDHLIIAQAISEGMTLVTQDQRAALYPVQIMFP